MSVIATGAGETEQIKLTNGCQYIDAKCAIASRRIYLISLLINEFYFKMHLQLNLHANKSAKESTCILY